MAQVLLAPRARRREARLHRLDEALLEVPVAWRARAAGSDALLPLAQLFGLEEQFEQLHEHDAVGILRLLGRPRVGRHGVDALLELLAALEDPHVVAVALAHLLAVEARHLGEVRLLRHERLGAAEDLAVQRVEGGRHVLRHLDVLDLVLAHGHEVRVVREDVGRHEDRVGEQAHVGLEPLGELVLVAVGAFEQPHARHAGQEPRQLADLLHVALAEEDGALGVEAQRQVGQRHVAHGLAQLLGLARRSQRVVVRDEVVPAQPGALLQGDVLPDGAEVVAEVRSAAGLDAGEHGLHGRRRRYPRRGEPGKRRAEARASAAR
jgi:hypothetical protein